MYISSHNMHIYIYIVTKHKRENMMFLRQIVCRGGKLKKNGKRKKRKEKKRKKKFLTKQTENHENRKKFLFPTKKTNDDRFSPPISIIS